MTREYYNASDLQYFLIQTFPPQRRDVYALAWKFSIYYLDHGLRDNPFNSLSVHFSSGTPMTRIRALLDHSPRFSNTVCWLLEESVQAPVKYTLSFHRERNGGTVTVEPHRDDSPRLRRKHFGLWDGPYGKE